MSNFSIDQKREYDVKYKNFKKLIRNLRRGKVEKISPKKADNNISKR